MPADLGALLSRHRATIFAAAPGVYRQMLRGSAPLHLPDLRHGLSAGELLPDAVRQDWRATTGTRIYEALGMSECSTFISASPTRPATPPATGYPQIGRRVAVLDASGDPVPRGDAGVLAIARDDPGLFLEYLNQPEETRSRFAGDWFLTGDLVAMDEAGAVTYLGRNDDMMNAGGFRVAPAEVESAMARLDGIGDVAAVEVRVRADASVIALFHTGTATEAALTDHAAANLARYKQPRLFQKVEALPRNANGKVNRRRLREEWNISA
jgi:acyl-coenzyme A synthetase/AMP-(fatty) acid ligase